MPHLTVFNAERFNKEAHRLLFHFFIFVSGIAAEGDSSPALEHLRAVGLLFQETDEHGTVQVAAVKVAGHTGYKSHGRTSRLRG